MLGVVVLEGVPRLKGWHKAISFFLEIDLTKLNLKCYELLIIFVTELDVLSNSTSLSKYIVRCSRYYQRHL